MPFSPEFPFGETFHAYNDIQAEFVSQFSALALLVLPFRGEDLIAEMQDAMTPSHIATADICKRLPSYGKVKLFQEKVDMEALVTEEAKSLVPKRLICRIWANDDFI